jgi:hypothetical protein
MDKLIAPYFVGHPTDVVVNINKACEENNYDLAQFAISVIYNDQRTVVVFLLPEAIEEYQFYKKVLKDAGAEGIK